MSVGGAPIGAGQLIDTTKLRDGQVVRAPDTKGDVQQVIIHLFIHPFIRSFLLFFLMVTLNVFFFRLLAHCL